MKHVGLFIGIAIFAVILFFLVYHLLPKNKYTIDTSSTAVVEKLQKLNRLETSEYTIEKVIDAGTNESALKQLLFGDRILLIAHGQVIAGVDLSKLQKNDISVNGSTVFLKLPPTQILQSSLDESQTRVYDRQTGLFTKGDQNLESQARAAAASSIRQAACNDGILKTAADNAQNQLTTLLKGLGFSTVMVTESPGSC